MKEEITEEEEFLRGCEIARVLQLKQALYYPTMKGRGVRHSPPRFNTTHGTKTILGLYRTVKQLVETPFSKS